MVKYGHMQGALEGAATAMSRDPSDPRLNGCQASNSDSDLLIDVQANANVIIRLEGGWFGIRGDLTEQVYEDAL
jgi:hypothetical protein